MMLGERVGGIGDQHAARGGGQQSGSGVDGVASDSIGGGGRIAEIARHNRPRVDADMELDSLAKLAGPVCTKVNGTGLDVESGTKGTLWVILVGDWRTEHRHCGITHELLHKPII